MCVKVVAVGSFFLPASKAMSRARAFEKLGCKVEIVDTGEHHQGLSLTWPLLRKVRVLLSRRKTLRRLYFVTKIEKPDIIFVQKNLNLSRDNLRKLRALGPRHLRIAHLNPDDPFGQYGDKIWKTFIRAIPEYDVHFVPKECNREEYKERGAKRVFVYDRSFDPENHRPWESSQIETEKWGARIGFIGSYAPHRESVLAAVVEEGLPLTLWGSGWAKGRYWDLLKSHWRGGNQFGEDYAKAISGMDIALHFLRHENRDLQDSRTFEIPACKTFMLAERTSDHQRLFRVREEADFFDSPDDCVAKCQFYLANPVEREKIALAGYRRALDSGYDYGSRVAEMLEAIQSNDVDNLMWSGIR